MPEVFSRESTLSPVMPEILNQASMFFLFGTIGAFPPIVWIPRINIQGILSPAVIPEIFSRESTFFLFLWFLKTVDP